MKCVVTGGGGFVGKALCHRLHGAGHSVLALARSQYPELERGGVSTAQVDLSIDPDSYSHLLQGVDAVFHVASKVDMWGEPEAFMRNNVTATKNLLRACQAQNVPYLIYTSTPSVVADGTNIRGVDESYPVARSHTAHYPATKALAEKLVRNASHEYGLSLIHI